MRTVIAMMMAAGMAFSAAPAGFAATSPGAKPAAKKPSAPAKPAAKPKPKSTTVVNAQPVKPYDAQGRPIVRAASAIVVDAWTGRVLFEKDADARRPPASTQKLLTALIVAEDGGLDQPMTIQPSDTWAEPTKLYLKAGEVYTRRQMLEMLLIRSMNDCALALARDNAGSVERFASRMNAKARELGAVSSNFVNPNGLPAPGQYSSARDMAKIARAAYRNPTIRSIVNRQSVTFRYADGRMRTFTNTNRLLGQFAACNGMKTGYTNAAGRCLISSARANGRDVLVVVLGSTSAEIWRESALLLNWGLRA